mmetsp:Transcript_3016/g.4600  ORF Transcript_3016/g.4600 Transcript_3016/m.4600 type:complete len:190 (+) Transcript_3016:64-633(+)|eukprot:CAMPEP_0185025936 /NCGR_PEP_ID=MMETSP1103-20130426/9469_1 /TAXON_ID=36769 /ORGANISM="Paraphysomonas bandaiensis, Strain Caron Lab Isolate" /LENGTH=189 /DNA_ID=CAMNT_0027559329 /DNA_START=17 /DNA_END=586 /DNA_ORIENTATION=+
MAHQLQNKWVLWEHDSTQKNYREANKEVCEFQTVEDFWKYWSFIPRPSEVFNEGHIKKEIDGRTIAGFCLFKKGIKPAWEDTANSSGAEWVCRNARSFEIADAYWENLVYGLIGETIDEGDEICGCRIVNKTTNSGKINVKIELWLRSRNKDVADRILTRMLNALTDGESSKPGSSRGLPDFQHKTHGN